MQYAKFIKKGSKFRNFIYQPLHWIMQYLKFFGLFGLSDVVRRLLQFSSLSNRGIQSPIH